MRGFLQAGRRGLSAEELSTPSAIRFMISELERLDNTCGELREYERLYNDQRVQIATLTSDRSVSRKTEILSYVCSAAGAAGLAAAQAYLTIPEAWGLGITILALSLILIVGGIATSRIFK